MAYIINLRSFSDERGNLTVIEKEIPFDIRRVFYIYGVNDSVRAKHRHHKTRQALICLNGSCLVKNNNGKIKEEFLIDTPDKCLIVEPEDWHSLHNFTKGSVLLVLASELFDPDDYIYEEYK